MHSLNGDPGKVLCDRNLAATSTWKQKISHVKGGLHTRRLPQPKLQSSFVTMKNLTLFLGCYILASSLVLDVQGFAPVAHRSSVHSALGLAKGGKGFGSTSEPAPKKKQETTVVSSTGSGNSSSPVADTPASRESGPNAGQRALAEMRRQRAKQKDAELRKVREMLQADKQLEETPAAIPERVAQRMGQRMLPFVGLPLLGGMGCFVAFWYLATYKGMEFQPVLVAISTIVTLVFSLLVSVVQVWCNVMRL